MNDLSPLVIAALAGGIGVVIASIAGAIVSVMTAWRTLASNVASINGHVNSEKTASEGRERAKDKEILLLREMLNKEQHSAGLLAQAQIQRNRGDLHQSGPGPVPVTVMNEPLTVKAPE